MHDDDESLEGNIGPSNIEDLPLVRPIPNVELNINRPTILRRNRRNHTLINPPNHQPPRRHIIS